MKFDKESLLEFIRLLEMETWDAEIDIIDPETTSMESMFSDYKLKDEMRLIIQMKKPDALYKI